MIDFARALPAIRAKVATDMARPGLARRKVLATVVHLLETTHIRVGNEDYAKENHSYGLTTLRNPHVKVTGTEQITGEGLVDKVSGQTLSNTMNVKNDLKVFISQMGMEMPVRGTVVSKLTLVK